MRVIAKTHIIILSLLFCLVSCIREDFDTPIVEEDDRINIELFTRLNDSFHTPVSRATDENAVDKEPWILIFEDNTEDGTGTRDNAMFVEAAQSQYNDNTKRSYVLLKPRTKKCWALILANPQSDFYANGTANEFLIENFESVLVGEYASLTKATSLLSAIPLTTTSVVNTPPFDGDLLPMSYVSESPLDGINAGTTFGTTDTPLILTRSVAKITVKNNAAAASGYTLKGIHSVYNLNNHTLLHNLSGDLPVATNLVNYVTATPTTEVFVSATDAGSDAIYVFEQAKNSTAPPYMILKMSYNEDEKEKNCYYKMEIIDTNKALIDFKRNFEYVFTITEIRAPGYGSFDEAMASVPNNNQIEYEVKITHTDGYESIANDKYYLSVSNRVCLIYDEANEQEYLAFTVVTNCTTPFSDESNYIESSEDHLIVTSPAKINIATDINTPVSTDVFVSVNRLGSGLIRLKLGNIEQAVTVKKEESIPSAGRILNYYTLHSEGYPIFDYYLSTGLVSSGSGITLSTTQNYIFPDNPSKVTAEDGIINIHVGNTGTSRNGIVWLTTIKNPGYPVGDDKNMARRIKVFLYQSG